MQQIKPKRTQKHSAMKEYTFFVKGMHCTSCEVLIEKKLAEFPTVKSVEASAGKGQVLIEFENERPTAKQLNKIFRKDNYLFSDSPIKEEISSEENCFPIIVVSALLLIAGFFALKRLGLAELINVNSKSSLLMFFAFGLVAGLSTCAALIGGLVLSMSKQWLGLYSKENSFKEKLQPHLLFNFGRLVSYAVLGGALGAIGGKLQISLKFTSFLVLAVSVVMLFLALQMLGVKTLRRFQFSMPKFATRYVADEKNFKGKYMPFVMGAFTFFLPCGFTITSQGLALVSGSAVGGGLIMLSFALGTLPVLLGIGVSTVKFSQKPHLSYKFLKIAGVLVLFFAFYNINNQLNLLGLPSFSNVRIKAVSGTAGQDNNELAEVVQGKQVIKMEASSSGYKPNYFKVQVGVPVRWEITDTGTSGCTNAVISRGLFSGEIPLTPGETSVKEFTPQKPGKYKFSCWMGMVSGIIEVVGSDAASAGAGNDNSNNIAASGGDVVPSGAKGCGCGGGN